MDLPFQDDEAKLTHDQGTNRAWHLENLNGVNGTYIVFLEHQHLSPIGPCSTFKRPLYLPQDLCLWAPPLRSRSFRPLRSTHLPVPRTRLALAPSPSPSSPLCRLHAAQGVALRRGAKLLLKRGLKMKGAPLFSHGGSAQFRALSVGLGPGWYRAECCEKWDIGMMLDGFLGDPPSHSHRRGKWWEDDELLYPDATLDPNMEGSDPHIYGGVWGLKSRKNIVFTSI